MSTVSPTSYETEFWGDCLNTWEEERKHFVYAPLMGITWDLAGASVIDIGGGPVSMLLKCSRRGACVVADPLLSEFPSWARDRYMTAAIEPWCVRGEDLDNEGFDEAWIYNVLQHVDDPQLVCENARRAAQVVRMFEWVGIPAYDGHPHELDQASLEEWLGGRGMTTKLEQDGCYGQAFYGMFA